jgi:hypothetical protein
MGFYWGTVDKANFSMLRSGSTRLIMPKKTRKEKLLAQTRRHVAPSFVSQSATPVADTTVVSSSVFQFTAKTSKKTQQMIADDTTELAVIKTDLAKTLILAVLAIGVEIGIYWVLRVQ